MLPERVVREAEICVGFIGVRWRTPLGKRPIGLVEDLFNGTGRSSGSGLRIVCSLARSSQKTL